MYKVIIYIISVIATLMILDIIVSCIYKKFNPKGRISYFLFYLYIAIQYTILLFIAYFVLTYVLWAD